MTSIARETLDFRRKGFFPLFSLLMPAFSLLIPPAVFAVYLHRPRERSPTMSYNIQSFGVMLKPRHIFGASLLDQ